MTKHITATFKTRAAAESYLRQLENLGVTSEQVSVLTSDTTRSSSAFGVEEATKAPEGATAGGLTGGMVGTVLGALATAGTLVIPGLNVVVGGALVGALAGLGTGALTGGLIGALIGAGIPEQEAKVYENEIKGGSILIAVTPASDEQEDRIRDILDNSDAYNIAA